MYNVRRTWDEPRKCPGHAALGAYARHGFPPLLSKKTEILTTI